MADAAAAPTFKLFDIPIKIETSFFVISFLVGSSRIAQPVLLFQWVAVSFVSVLLHELGHAWAFRRFGSSPSIVLHAMGGSTYGDLGAYRHSWKDIVVSLAGPGAGFLLGLAVLLVSKVVPTSSPEVEQLIADLLWVNIGWGFVNLLPIEPLDGSHALRSALNPLGAERAQRIASIASWLTLAGALAYGIAAAERGLIFIVGWVAISRGAAAWRARKDKQIEAKLNEGFRLLNARDYAAAEAIARTVLSSAPGDWAWRNGTYLLMWCDLGAGDGKKAWALVDQFRGREAPLPALLGVVLEANTTPGEVLPRLDKLISANGWTVDFRYWLTTLNAAHAWAELEAWALGPGSDSFDDHALSEAEAALFYAGQFASALRVSERRFERFKHTDSAFNAACSLTKLGRLDEALAWLARAVEHGYRDVKALREDADLAGLRSHQGFQQLIRKLEKPAQ